MLRIIILFIFLISSLLSKSQDTINLRNGNLIVGKVIEINPQYVKYKKAENIDGPAYIEDKGNIASIKYSNGLIENIQDIPSIKDNPSITLANPCKIERVDNRYYFKEFNGSEIKRPIGTLEIMKLSRSLGRKEDHKDLLKLVRKTKGNMHRSVGFMISGITVAVLGGMVCISSLMEYPNSYKTQAQVDENRRWGLSLFLSSLTVGVGLESLAVLNNRKKKKRISEMVNLYNSYSN